MLCTVPGDRPGDWALIVYVVQFCEPGFCAAQSGFGVLAQLGQQVAAGHARGEGLLHQPREVGLARLGEPLLGVRDRRLQRRSGAAADGRALAYGEVSHWRTRLPIASASPFL